MRRLTWLERARWLKSLFLILLLTVCFLQSVSFIRSVRASDGFSYSVPMTARASFVNRIHEFHTGASNSGDTITQTVPSSFDIEPSSSFSIFWITDTQYLSSTYPQKFNDLANWIIHNTSYYNAKMVVHTGDIVDNPSTTSQWDAANAAMSLLLNNNTPYCWCAGNHDQLSMGNPNTDWKGSKYRAFNQTIMEQKPYWASDICDGKDTAVHFSVNNVDFLIIDIEYHANSTVLTWVNNLLNAYSNAYVILATHSYFGHSLNYDGTWASTLNSNVLATHSNVLMTLNGHFHGDSGAHQTVGKLNELMFDRQDSENYMGAATVTILTFETADDQITVKTYDINTGQFMADPSDQFNLAATFPNTANHDVSIEGAITSKSVVGSGYSTSVNVTAANVGDFTETFRIIAYANATVIASENVALSAGDSRTLTIPWDTTGFAMGNYTVTAYAEPVSGDTNTANNNFTGSVVKITIPGDINGDFSVSRADLLILANVYGSHPGDTRWNPDADIDSNNVVDLPDVVSLAFNYGQNYS